MFVLLDAVDGQVLKEDVKGIYDVRDRVCDGELG